MCILAIQTTGYSNPHCWDIWQDQPSWEGDLCIEEGNIQGTRHRIGRAPGEYQDEPQVYYSKFLYIPTKSRGRQKTSLPRYKEQASIITFLKPKISTKCILKQIPRCQGKTHKPHLRPNLLLFNLERAIVGLNSLTSSQDEAEPILSALTTGKGQESFLGRETEHWDEGTTHVLRVKGQTSSQTEES